MQFVGIGMPIARHNFTNNNTLGKQGEILHLLHFETRHRQPFTQLISAIVAATGYVELFVTTIALQLVALAMLWTVPEPRRLERR